MKFLRAFFHGGSYDEIEAGRIRPESIRRLVVVASRPFPESELSREDFVWNCFRNQNVRMFEALKGCHIQPRVDLAQGSSGMHIDPAVLTTILEPELRERNSAYIQFLPHLLRGSAHTVSLLLVTIFASPRGERGKFYIASLENALEPV